MHAHIWRSVLTLHDLRASPQHGGSVQCKCLIRQNTKPEVTHTHTHTHLSFPLSPSSPSGTIPTGIQEEGTQTPYLSIGMIVTLWDDNVGWVRHTGRAIFGKYSLPLDVEKRALWSIMHHMNGVAEWMELAEQTERQWRTRKPGVPCVSMGLQELDMT